MPPVQLEGPRELRVLSTNLLSQDAFASFGTVIENPAPSLVPSPHIIQRLPSNATQANQGSALKYHVTQMVDLYASSSCKEVAKAVMNIFVCAPRPLLPIHDSSIEGLFPVHILERHPYTTQTFIPLGLSSLEKNEVCYLVIVAPSLPPSPADEALPAPTSTTSSGSLPGRGLPDLRQVQAFIAHGSQAVTYGAGTWHAPMVVIGKKPIDFVVVQYANGVPIEDCQEAEWESREGAGISIAVPKLGLICGSSKL